jgi:hypothetical protein
LRSQLVEEFRLIYGLLGKIVDYPANGCCDGEMVQFVALFSPVPQRY